MVILFDEYTLYAVSPFHDIMFYQNMFYGPPDGIVKETYRFILFVHTPFFNHKLPFILESSDVKLFSQSNSKANIIMENVKTNCILLSRYDPLLSEK